MQSLPETSRRCRRHHEAQQGHGPGSRCRQSRASRTSRSASTGSTRRGARDASLGMPNPVRRETSRRAAVAIPGDLRPVWCAEDAMSGRERAGLAIIAPDHADHLPRARPF
jgi:hypothetical protein